MPKFRSVIEKERQDNFWDLCEAGSPVDIKNAIDAGLSVNYVRTFINHSADLNLKDTNGMTALLYAAMTRRASYNTNSDVVNALIEAGAENLTDKSRRTALMLAAEWNNHEVVGALLDAGANVRAKDNFGKKEAD